MGRSIERLKALSVERSLKKPGMYCDGGGLWLCVSSPTAASWLFRYQLRGKAREMGLGPARDITLQEARTAAAAARKCKAMGSDPLHERDVSPLRGALRPLVRSRSGRARRRISNRIAPAGRTPSTQRNGQDPRDLCLSHFGAFRCGC